MSWNLWDGFNLPGPLQGYTAIQEARVEPPKPPKRPDPLDAATFWRIAELMGHAGTVTRIGAGELYQAEKVA